jgi:hypothetical protein
MLAQICVRRNQRQAGAFRQRGHPLARKSQARDAFPRDPGICLDTRARVLPGIDTIVV